MGQGAPQSGIKTQLVSTVLSNDGLSVVQTFTQQIPQSQLTGQLSSLQNQVSNLNTQIAQIQANLALFPVPVPIQPATP